ncbi:MAG: Arc family DNA-binding protein [Acidobacteria bacterium]|nr:Arc family DNA-binding protein [Acidobacteriota bacterium]MBS1864792.1 Arc family DNA-binding protein [Acidobacteriota bacterium]
MAQLIVRNLENSVKTKLQKRAKRHGRSMEEEVREILRDAAKAEKEAPPKEGLGTRIAAHFRDCGLRPGEEIPEFKGFTLEPPDFGE